MHQNRVAWLHAPFPNYTPIAEAGAIVGLQQAGEIGLHLGPRIVLRVDVKSAPALVWLRFGAGGHLDGVLSLARRSVRVSQLELALVLGARLQVQDAAGEGVGDGVVEVLATPVDVLTTDPHQRHGVSPDRVAHGPVLDVHRRIAIGIAADGPFKSQVQKRGVFDGEFVGLGGVLGVSGAGGEQDEGKEFGTHRCGPLYSID